MAGATGFAGPIFTVLIEYRERIAGKPAGSELAGIESLAGAAAGIENLLAEIFLGV